MGGICNISSYKYNIFFEKNLLFFYGFSTSVSTHAEGSLVSAESGLARWAGVAENLEGGDAPGNAAEAEREQEHESEKKYHF